jgi:hypothetical protein
VLGLEAAVIVCLGDRVAVVVAHADDAGAGREELPDDQAALDLVDDLELDREGLALEPDEARQGGAGANAGLQGEEDGVEALERRHRPCRTTTESGDRTGRDLRGHRVSGEESGKSVGVDHVKMSGDGAA